MAPVDGTPPPDDPTPDPVSSGEPEIDALMANAKGALWHLINEMEALANSIKGARLQFERFKRDFENYSEQRDAP